MNQLPVPQPGPEYMVSAPMEMEAPASPVQIQRFFIFLKKFWWLPVLTLVLAFVAATVFVIIKPPTYTSTASMWESAKIRLPEGALFSEDLQTYLATQMELLKSLKLRQATLSHMPTNAVPLDKERKPLPVKIKVSQAPKSSVFLVQASSADPTFAQAYLDALMNEYLDYKKEVRKYISGGTLASISDQVSKAEKELQEQVDALIAYQRTNNLAVLQEESTISGGYLARLKTQLSDLQLEDRLLRSSSLQATNSAAGTNSTLEWLQAASTLGSGPTAAQPNDRQTAFKELELLRLQRERLSKFLRPKHPKIVKLDTDIDRGEKLLDIYRRQSREQLAASHQSIQMRIENVIGSIKEWESKVVEANSRVADAERLKQNVNRSQAIYERLVALLRNVDISRNIDQESLSVLESAAPALRSWREELMAFGLAAFAGLVLGIGCVFLIVLRDDRFTSVTEIADKIQDEVVAQVPDITKLTGKNPLLLAEGDGRHMYLESYRNLRSALLFLATEGARPRSIMVTSALPSEGKSTISANLAQILAQGGARVLLVDGDLRKGVLHDLFRLNREPGLTELLLQPSLIDTIIQTNGTPNLSFISSGRRIPNPGDLFLGATLQMLLDRWKNEYDYVIIDSTPVFAADDATTLAPKMDGTLFVVRSRYSGAGQVKEALELLYRRRAKVLGLIFNRADTASRSYHYYKYASYYADPEETTKKA